MSNTEKNTTPEVETTDAKSAEEVVKNNQSDKEDSKVAASYVKVESKKEGKKNCPKAMFYVVAIAVVAIIILGVLYLLEKEGRSSTNLFGSIIASQAANMVVATVNGDKIINSELEVSINQFAQAAEMQGLDPADESVSSEIRDQALEVLVNTMLLKQAAIDQGLSVSDEAADDRYKQIVDGLGGEEVLLERIAELGIDEARLQQDIRDELLIQSLLDTVVMAGDSEVSEEEVLGLYEQAGGEEAGLPPLEEVREQVESEILASREQLAIETYINDLRDAAEIEIK